MKYLIVFCLLSFNVFSQDNTYRNRSLAKYIFYKINTIRAQNGLDTLLWNVKLDSSSLLHARQMALYNFFSHTNSYDTKYEKPKDRALAYGYKYKAIAENLAFYETSLESKITEEEIAKKFITNWVASKGHFKNIMNKEYKEAGVNIIKFITKDRVKYYAVQNFGLE